MAAASSDQHVQLHVTAKNDAVLQTFKQQFEPVSLASAPSASITCTITPSIPHHTPMHMDAAPCLETYPKTRMHTCAHISARYTMPPRSQAEGYTCSLSFPEDTQHHTSAGLDCAAYAAALSTRQLGQLLLTTPSINSTQEFMRRHRSVLPEGTVLAADRQTSGKGAVLRPSGP